LIAATTGLGILAIVVKAADNPTDRSTMSAYDATDISLMSAPAAKIFGPP
jgi:hypothetical protein